MLPAPVVGLGAIIACAAITSAPAGCMCTEVSCIDGVTVSLRRPGDSWPSGTYVFDLVADGQTSQCVFVWDDKLAGYGVSKIFGTCDVQGFSVTLIDTTKVADQGTTMPGTTSPLTFYVELGIAGTPDTVSVTASRDGTTILENSFEPDYSTHRPNGPFCSPACDLASQTITVP